MNKNSRTFEYFIDGALTPSQMLSKLVKIDRNKEEEYFRSAPEPYWKNSRKIVGSQFKEKILQNSDDQAVFFYSNHCHSCKLLGPFYEEIAREKLIDDVQ